MKRFLILSFLSQLLAILGYAQSEHIYSAEFASSGEFKVLQLSDCKAISRIERDQTTEFIKRMIDVENPQLIVVTGFTGDIELIKSLCKSKNVYCLCLTEKEGADKVIPLRQYGKKDISHLIYCFDSYACKRKESNKDENGITFNQIGWYRQLSKKYTLQNSGMPIPSIAFMHKPLMEYKDGIDVFGKMTKTKKGIIQKTGECNENISCESVNSGLFTSMHECGDVRGIFCSSNLNNNFALVWKNIMLAYGQCSSIDYSSKGVRVIILKDGSDQFETYIRTDDNEIKDHCTYPDNFSIIK